MEIQLRELTHDDIPTLFAHQNDPEAHHMAAFGAKDPSDEEAVTAHWERILANDAIIKRGIVGNGQLIGNLGCFEMFELLSVAYWIDRPYWGQGIATEALRQFLDIVPTRPLYARVASDNLGSRRVLEKNGFVVIERENVFSPIRDAEIEESLLRLS